MIDFFRGRYEFLSNFYPAPFTTPKGTFCRSVEHAFQACKASTKEERNWVLEAKTAQEAKRRGRKVKMWPDWNSIRLKVMKSFVRMKFQQNPDLARKLLETGDEKLIEGNTWKDTFWGICEGKGENHLGRILMEVRSELRE